MIPTRAALAVLAAVIAGCSAGGFDDSLPFDGAQGGTSSSSLIRRDAGLLVDPAGRHAWVQHSGSWFAVNTTSGAITHVLPLAGLSDVRVAFLSDEEAVLIANDPNGCPFQTNACTRVTHVDTVVPSVGAQRWEGSTLDFSVQSPSKRFVALSGGFATSGVYVVDGSDDLRPIQWESIAGGTGWSRCYSGSCEERLWMVGRNAIYSWPVDGGELAPEPDLAFPGECNATYRISVGDSYQTAPLVAASSDGRWVALTCGRTFSLYDAHTGSFRDTGMNGPVSFVGGVLVGHFNTEEDDGYGGGGESCLQYVQPGNPSEVRSICLPTSSGLLYYVTAGGWAVASSPSSIFVVYGEGSYGEYVEITGVSITDGKFVERLGHSEIYFTSAESLHILPLDALDPDYGDFEGSLLDLGVPFAVRDLNILPSQDELALRSADSVAFLSLVTGSASVIGLP